MPEVIGIDHIYITASDISRSEAFYDLLLRDVLRFRKASKFRLGLDEHINYYNRHFGVVIRPARIATRHDPFSSGLHHFCFRVESCVEVTEVALQLQAAGIGASVPQLYPQYAGDYFATFFEDPDGIRLEVTNYRAERKHRNRHWGEGRPNLGNAMTNTGLTHRLARVDDLDALSDLMHAAISELQKPFLDEHQIASSRTIMGLDTQLIEDGTYFIVESDGQLAGCGGWSRRATLYGGDQSPGRSATLLDPTRDSARVRAMYTHPDHVRKGVGRMILWLCEAAATRAGFNSVELMATMAGEPLYRACGYEVIERVADDRGGAAVPLVRMRKSLQCTDQNA